MDLAFKIPIAIYIFSFFKLDSIFLTSLCVCVKLEALCVTPFNASKAG